MKLIKHLAFAVLVAAVLYLCIDIARFPECYSTTARYHLQNDIAAGDELAIDYYQTQYIENGIELF